MSNLADHLISLERLRQVNFRTISLLYRICTKTTTTGHFPYITLNAKIISALLVSQLNLTNWK